MSTVSNEPTEASIRHSVSFEMEQLEIGQGTQKSFPARARALQQHAVAKTRVDPLSFVAGIDHPWKLALVVAKVGIGENNRFAGRGDSNSIFRIPARV